MRNWYEIKALSDDKAEISIYEEIGGWGVSAKQFIDELKALTAGDITLSINSPGGSLFDGIAMYHALKDSKANITVKVVGIAASAASLVAMAGNKIVMPENTFMMIHNPMTMAWGNASEMREMADLLDKIGTAVVSTYVARTGKSTEEIQTLLDAETYLTAQEAVDQGFADEVEPALRIAAAFDVEGMPSSVVAAFKNAQQLNPTNSTEPSSSGDTPSTTKPEGSGKEPSGQVSNEPSEPPTNEPQVPFADQVTNLAKEAGMGEFASVWALITDDLSVVQAHIKDAKEIQALCVVARKPDTAPGYIKAQTPVAKVREQLMATLAQEDEDASVSTVPPASSATGSTPQAKGVTTASIWAARRAANPR